jgi:hypothetical protein
MNSNLHKLVYCSRNCIQGSDSAATEELQVILASARKNNLALGITGALLYNNGNFAQFLEGPLASVERIFEVIQCDPRHTEATVVYNGPTPSATFRIGLWPSPAPPLLETCRWQLPLSTPHSAMRKAARVRRCSRL